MCVCVCVCVCVCFSLSVVSNSLRPHGPVRLLCPWNSLGKNTGVSCHSLFLGIFTTQGLNPGLLHCRQILYCLSHQWRPRGLKSSVFPCQEANKGFFITISLWIFITRESLQGYSKHGSWLYLQGLSLLLDSLMAEMGTWAERLQSYLKMRGTLFSPIPLCYHYQPEWFLGKDSTVWWKEHEPGSRQPILWTPANSLWAVWPRTNDYTSLSPFTAFSSRKLRIENC